MKNVANAPSTPATTINMARMPMFIATAIGALLSPKHTGQAKAARGAASMTSVRSVKSVLRIINRPAEAVAPQALRLPLKRGAVEGQPDAAGERRHAGHRITQRVDRKSVV